MSQRNRKFYKTEIKVTVLSEEPFEYESLSDVDFAINEGECSGKFETLKVTKLSGKETATELQVQGSDPEFFQLDVEGNDLED